MRPAQVMVVDDHPVVRDGVTFLLRRDPSLVVGGYADCGRAALERAPGLSPDLILLDLRLPDMLAPELVRAMRRLLPRTRVVLYTAHGDHLGISTAMAAGAHGVLLKDATGTDLVAALRRVLRGERVYDQRLRTGPPAGATPQGNLTRREYEVLRVAAQGHTNPEIAVITGLARNSVKTYLQSTLRKLEARNRVEAIRKATDAGLL
jgi:two-component system nitrate/nitrite response regulator NarL